MGPEKKKKFVRVNNSKPTKKKQPCCTKGHWGEGQNEEMGLASHRRSKEKWSVGSLREC